MITKRTVIDQRVIDDVDGILYIRFRKEVIEDGKTLSFEQDKEFIEPGYPVKQAITEIDKYLVDNKYAPLSDVDKYKIIRLAELEHSKDVILAYTEKQRRIKEAAAPGFVAPVIAPPPIGFVTKVKKFFTKKIF